MTYKTDPWTGQHPDDLRKAHKHFATIEAAGRRFGVSPDWVRGQSSKIIVRNLRELQRLARIDAEVPMDSPHNG